MDLRLISGVLELSYISCFVVSHHFGPVCYDLSYCLVLFFCSSTVKVLYGYAADGFYFPWMIIKITTEPRVTFFEVLFYYLLPLFEFLLLILFIFCKETEQGVAQAIIRSVIDFKRDPWPRVSETAKDLVRKMLEPDPKKRLSAAQVLGMFSVWLCVSKIYYLWNKI